nr:MULTISPECIES: transposase [Rhizobium]
MPFLIFWRYQSANRGCFLADKGYDGDFLREELLIHGIRPMIPPKANRKNPPACDFRAYKDRNRIERMFNRLKGNPPILNGAPQ